MPIHRLRRSTALLACTALCASLSQPAHALRAEPPPTASTGKRSAAPASWSGSGKDRLRLDGERPARAANPNAHGRQPAGDAEAKLIAVYRLIGAGQSSNALQQAQQLVAEYPTFQLAQLVYGDLLTTRTRPLRAFGDVPDALAKANAGGLAELRDESLSRLRALRERPPPGTIPAQFLQLSPQNRHAIAIDASRSRLYLFNHEAGHLRLMGDYYISVGKSGIEKSVEGDMRTPLGVYFITNTLNPKSLKDFYGSGALPINYPNPLDVKRGKTGGGIWLHGTPPHQFARAPKASDGCVVLSNPDLSHIMRTVAIRTTPVVIAPSIEWVSPGAMQADAAAFQTAMQGWRAAKSSGNLARVLSYYSPDFQADNKALATFTPVVQKEMEAVRGRSIELKDLSFLHWHDGSGDTMVVTFGEVVEGNITGARKRQYWGLRNREWKIFFEGIIG